jgi:hypothetical protein
VPLFVVFFSIYAGITALGLMYSIVENKSHGFFGGKVWWGTYRYFHASMWLLTAILGAMNYKWSGVFLLLDVSGAIIFGIRRHRVCDLIKKNCLSFV